MVSYNRRKMVAKESLFLIIMALFIDISDLKAQKTDLTKQSWSFRKSGDTEWLPATVPGTVHTDLLANKKIAEPFYRTNEKELQWIDKEDWEYKTIFDLTKETLSREVIEIVFDGLDTYADVFINEQKVLVANNMFRTWKTDVKKYLVPGKNELRILFHSPINYVMPQYNSLGYTIPVSNNDQSDQRVSVYSRKAGYHFGWDWGPRFVTSGIWRPIYLNAWNKINIEDLYIKQLSLADNKAEIEVSATMNSTGEGVKQLRLYAENNPVPLVSKDVWVSKGIREVKTRFSMDQIELWWPNGMGKQKLYKFKLEIAEGKAPLATKEQKIGFRNIEVVEESDSEGKSFYFKVNGKPVFMKGANYIPQDSFLPRVGNDRYEHILGSAAESNMNMIRVWGGGIYENDIFYELCDEKGLLVWQDFMFACSMYPPYDDLMNNIYEEAVDNIKRLRNHPSIALWCGNNEIAGFMNQNFWNQLTPNWRTDADYKKTIDTYDEIFNRILPAAVKAYDDDRFYWSSSPNAINYTTKYITDKRSGDAHYWGVWWGKDPFEKFNDNISPFMSEYGFQSFPELATVEQYALPADYDIESEVMKAHQRSSIGNTTIAHYMKDMFTVPAKFEDFLYVGQLLQSEGIKMAIEAHRRAMPFCMGTLFWQIDDCWPVASWSSIDYYGRWKAQQYMAKKAFEPVLVSPFREGDAIKIYTVSDLFENSPALLQISLMDFEGKVLRKEEKTIVVPSNTSTVVYSLAEADWTKNIDRTKTFISIKLLQNNKELCRNSFFFEKPKQVILPKANIQLSKVDDDHIAVSTDKLARFIWLELPNSVNAFSDNYFDLLPGEQKVLKINDKYTRDFKLNEVKITSLADISDKTE